MCVFSVAYRVFPECPIFVLTNRDESTERPSLSPRVCLSGGPGRQRALWFGGADERAGGTWLGINPHGLLAAVTNRQTTAVTPPNARSRGLLCREVLTQSSAESAFDWVHDELSTNDYAGFNLIILSARSAFVLEKADDKRVRTLEPGVHTIGNGHLDAADDRRVQRTQNLATEMIRGARHWTDCVEQAKAICGLHAQGDEPGICLHGEKWGTVGSTIVGLALDSRESVYHYAAGPPCRTPYVDYSTSLRQLFGDPASIN
jgi:uncharacterized protein with NRDE domain